MATSIRIMIIASNQNDALSFLDQLKNRDYEITWTRIEDFKNVKNAFENETWDVVIANYSLDSFNISEVLPLIKTEGYDIPLIVIFETAEQEKAIALMDAGAQDCLEKNNLARLPFVIEREISNTKDRQIRKKTEHLLEISEERFTNIVNSSIDAMLSIDLLGFISFVNKASEKMFGYKSNEIIGHFISKLIAPNDEFDINVFLDFHKSTNSSLSSKIKNTLVIDAINKSGKEFPVELSLSKVKNSQEDAFVIIVRDISEKKRSQKILQETELQLKMSQKMEAIGRLAGGIAHDFNNLLGVIIGYSDLICLDLNNEDPLSEDINEISRAAKQAAELTNQLLAFSRKQVLQPKIFDINEVVIGSKKMLARVIGEDIDFITKLTQNVGFIKADPGQIEQVIMNLVVNARDAMVHGGTLTIKTENHTISGKHTVDVFGQSVEGDCVVISVIDTGYGMDQSTQDHIFEPFFTTKPQGKGTGLGLSTVYGIVKQSGGAINVESEVKKGTSFSVFFPRVSKTAETDSQLICEKNCMGNRETILLVEDEEMLRILIAKILKKNGYHVLEASHADEAICICNKKCTVIDLLLTDVVMPQINGRELSEKLSSIRPEMKIIFMSGYTDEAMIKHGIRDWGLPFIQKPFSAETICNKIRQVLDK